ncbi:MAG TPA: endolytic transglycosylase MltG [Acidimicrobiales bacterium]|jgi:UPF0755 protein|nr:endolytic transglycosylase MltG [Acidimicrobiales bacterium]
MSPTTPVRQGQHRRKARRLSVTARRRIAVVLAGLVVVVLGFALWYELESHALGASGKQVVVEVTTGQSANTVASSLAKEGVIGSSLAFKISDAIHGSPTITAGSYLFHQNLTFGEVRAILNGGPNVSRVNVEYGLTLAEVAAQVDGLSGHGGESFTKVAASGVVHSVFSPPGSNNLEGMLGTGFYEVLPGESDTTLLTDMVRRFDTQAAANGLSTASAAALGLTPYQLITVASVVEKEGYIVKNMPDVARVIYNRLAQNIALQMDATVLYALGQDGGPVTSADERVPTPYNTYLNKGLPPTPICMPQPAAFAAAVHPPAGGWLYFELVKKDGTEAFSDTFAEQLANEALARSRGLG